MGTFSSICGEFRLATSSHMDDEKEQASLLLGLIGSLEKPSIILFRAAECCSPQQFLL